MRLRWNPFQAGTRGPRHQAAARATEALRWELLEAQRNVRAEVTAAVATLTSARGALAVGKTGVEQARETVRVENERYRAGRVTTNDLLEAEAELRAQTTARDVAELEVVRAEIRLEIALGRFSSRLENPS